eukprot:6159404-Pleurochrysis_carterae.AAC.1
MPSSARSALRGTEDGLKGRRPDAEPPNHDAWRLSPPCAFWKWVVLLMARGLNISAAAVPCPMAMAPSRVLAVSRA